MSTYVLTDGAGLIVNRIELDSPEGWEAPAGLTLTQETDTSYEIGGKLVDGVYTPPPQPPPPPPQVAQSISDRQFFQQLAVMGSITQQEALAAVKTGDIPAAMQTAISKLPQDEQFAAQMLISGAATFERYHPKTLEIGSLMQWTSEQMDDLWRAAALL